MVSLSIDRREQVHWWISKCGFFLARHLSWSETNEHLRLSTWVTDEIQRFPGTRLEFIVTAVVSAWWITGSNYDSFCVSKANINSSKMNLSFFFANSISFPLKIGWASLAPALWTIPPLPALCNITSWWPTVAKWLMSGSQISLRCVYLCVHLCVRVCVCYYWTVLSAILLCLWRLCFLWVWPL